MAKAKEETIAVMEEIKPVTKLSEVSGNNMAILENALNERAQKSYIEIIQDISNPIMLQFIIKETLNAGIGQKFIVKDFVNVRYMLDEAEKLQTTILHMAKHRVEFIGIFEV